MTTNGPKISNGIVSNNPDFFARADPDVNNKMRQVVRIDQGTGTAESLVDATHPLKVSVAASTALQDVNLTNIAGGAVTTGIGGSNSGTQRVVLASDQTPIPAYISDAAGTPILTQADALAGTGLAALPIVGYDQNYSTFGMLPLSNAGTTVPVEVQNTVTTSNYPGAFSTLANITSAASTITLSGIGGYGGVSVSIYGTYGSVAFTLEGSTDSTNWFQLSMLQQGTSAVAVTTSGLLTNTIRSWIAPTMGALYVRARATAWTSGTASVRIAAVSAGVPIIVTAVQSATYTVSGTVTANNQNTSGGGDGSSFRILDVNATATTISASACCIGSLNAYNNTAGTLYIKMYNKTGATSANTPSQVYGIKAGETIPLNLGSGVQFKTACSVRCVTGVADADNTAPAANGMVLSGSYS